MLYAILCYNEEDVVWSWSQEEDKAVMDRLAVVNERLTAYMVPRYLESRAEELPKTPTGKVQKVLLRATGTAGAWDREAGI